MYNYSIMPLDTDHIDEICEDIREQYEKGIATCALFKMTLVPEGNPPVDKAKILCEKYDLFRERLSKMGTIMRYSCSGDHRSWLVSFRAFSVHSVYLPYKWVQNEHRLPR